MTQSAITQAGMDASVSTFVKTLLDDATATELCKSLGIAASDGWVDSTNETWTYVSADSPTFVFSVNSDVTTKYAVGQRIKLTQTTVKYFIITAVGTFGSGVTNITVYGGTDYTLANAAISANYYSSLKAPFGFPLSPNKWTQKTPATGNYVADANATVNTNTVTNIGSMSLAIPIGAWNVSYNAVPHVDDVTSSTYIIYTCGLSTANNTFSDAEFKDAFFGLDGAGTTDRRFYNSVQKNKYIDLAAKTTYYLNISGSASAGTTVGLHFRGDSVTTVIQAVCAYL